MVKLNSIDNEAEYEAALLEIERLWDTEEATPEGDRLEILTTLVEAYEEANFPMDLPGAIDARERAGP